MIRIRSHNRGIGLSLLDDFLNSRLQSHDTAETPTPSGDYIVPLAMGRRCRVESEKRVGRIPYESTIRL